MPGLLLLIATTAALAMAFPASAQTADEISTLYRAAVCKGILGQALDQAIDVAGPSDEFHAGAFTTKLEMLVSGYDAYIRLHSTGLPPDTQSRIVAAEKRAKLERQKLNETISSSCTVECRPLLKDVLKGDSRGYDACNKRCLAMWWKSPDWEKASACFDPVTLLR